MEQTLLPGLIRSSLYQMRHALERKEHQVSVRVMQELFYAFSILADHFERVLRGTHEVLGEGVEGGKLAFVLKETCDQTATALEQARVARELADARVPTYPSKAEDLAGFETSVRRVERVRERLGQLLQWVDTPAPRIDPGKVAGPHDSPEPKGYESIDDILARLEGGGNL